ncbi:MAG TPA: lysophospholipid acyltransferase family protein [Chloroflexota bacterium]|nr:lysophospholipid acyltransferase family protein [Chloroflexota bacterium]
MAANPTHRRFSVPRLPPSLHSGLFIAASALMEMASKGILGLPPSVRYGLSDVLTTPAAPFFLGRRPAVARNYAVVLGGSATSPRARRLARASVGNYGRMAMDFLAVRVMSDKEILSWARPRHLEHFEAALGDGRGIIMALPHLGSWDVAAAFAQAYGCDLTVITEDTWAARLVANSRDGHRLTLVPRGGSLRPVFRSLLARGCVAMLCDMAPPGVPAVAVPFFGHPAPFPVGPARLAHHTGAPILIVGSVRQPDHSYILELLPPIRANRSLPAAQAIPAATAAIATGFEQLISAYPEQWYAFRSVWPDQDPTTR